MEHSHISSRSQICELTKKTQICEFVKMCSHNLKFTKLRSSLIGFPPYLPPPVSSPSLTPQHHLRCHELLVACDNYAPSGTHSCYKKRFHKALGDEGRQLGQRKIPRVSLLDASASPWRKLYYSYNNQALITVTGLSYHAFEYLVNKFTWYFEQTFPSFPRAPA